PRLPPRPGAPATCPRRISSPRGMGKAGRRSAGRSSAASCCSRLPTGSCRPSAPADAKLAPVVKILVLHGPNLNLLGTREPAVYGKVTLAEVDRLIREHARRRGGSVDCRQTNHEGQLVDCLQTAPREGVPAVAFLPGAFPHSPRAPRDAAAAIKLPVAEVHLSTVHGREELRRRSVIAAVARGQIGGFGPQSYLLGSAALTGPARRPPRR